LYSKINNQKTKIMENTKLKVAVIGLGNIGKVVASNLVKSKRPVIIADRTFTKAKELAHTLGSLAQPMQVEEAIRQADILVLSVWFSTIKELFTSQASALEGKIIIDPSNPIAADEKGGFKKIIGEQESAGEILAGLLPKNARLVKALGSLGAATLENAAYANPRSVLFYASKDTDLEPVIEELIHDNGFDALRVGGPERAIRMEVFGDLHEFGALGKAVSLAEAKTKI
jgi:predicted dinucleotide-binding enzyme